MFDLTTSKATAHSFGRTCALAVAIMTLSTMLGATGPAWPQAAKSSPQPPSQTAPPPPATTQGAPDQAPPQPAEAAPPPQQENPGLINEIGKLFDNPSSILPSLPTLKSPKEVVDDFNTRAKDAAKDATDGLSRLTTPLIVRGRVVCPVAANGAPDCKVASDKLCRSKGFKEGKSVDMDSAQACSAAALLSGGNREPGTCRTETYVTRALCQ
jgi:hypothetical protein